MSLPSCSDKSIPVSIQRLDGIIVTTHNVIGHEEGRKAQSQIFRQVALQ
jgi:hypothetical protein